MPLHPSGDISHTGPTGRQDPSLPQVFGRYLLVQRLSRGGMGEIFLAKHGLAGFEKLAVIKKVLPHLAADAQFISRFVDEAQVAIKLQHVNVAQVFEVGRVGDEYFLALEYVEGRDLRRTLAVLGHRKKRLPVDLGLFIARELANGLAYAHRRTNAEGSLINLVHCDISPPNVLVSFEGETKVIDFGIAKSALRGTATDPKMGFGKFGYMAPEQLIRGGVVDHRTDIYAAGVVLFELLTLSRLYDPGPEPDYRGLARKVAKGEHPLPSDLDPMLTPYDDLVATALRPKLEDRYQSAAEFRDAIQQCLVAVNPTISTDQLGAFMRELFSDEMTAQRELHERVAKAHLADFQEQFHTQTISTVSFALASLPLQPPAETGPATPTPRPPQVAGGSRPPQPRSPALDTQAPPTSILGPDDVPLADGTGAVIPTELPPRRGRVLVIATTASLVIAGGIVFAMKLGWDAPKQIEPELVVTDTPKPKVEPIRTEPKIEPIEVGSGSDIEMSPDPVGHRPAPAHGVAKPHDHHQQTHRVEAKQEPKAPEWKIDRTAPLTREAVAAKQSAVAREYHEFTAKFGGRLDGEWNTLLNFTSYHPNDFEEISRRLDAFRANMRK